ncbi:hypothetical protein GpartN1_g7165.t1 [Galdieria partita]|uniref:Nicotinate phosphoribosyltransferase n=1 Tax=Galdieria partita TaxID=83374 RepID=A0A9C7Q308_9RHOD|nr:hypothetical protein GpartN1_g7165.t1 [Galdieria partita]
MNTNQESFSNCNTKVLHELQPTNHFVNALLTDLYQLTMAYCYWKQGRHKDQAVFDLFFRKCPFDGEFAIFAGLEECIRFLATFRFTESDIQFLKNVIQAEEEFFNWLRYLDASQVVVYGVSEGSVVFPLVPLLRVEGPLAVCQLLETTLLNLINYASLVATNAARFRLAVGEKSLLEFGLRRAQGPDGGMSASRYTYLGGFDATSNVLASKLFAIPCSGTHAHSFVQTFSDCSQLVTTKLLDSNRNEREFVQLVLETREKLGYSTNQGELAAFISYAQCFPDKFLVLVDTYDTLSSGVPNFICVALCLLDFGYKPLGIRLDSGDLSYLSKAARREISRISRLTGNNELNQVKIAASNDLNEATLLSLQQQGHEIDVFGIGTHLVTCQQQPALGCVYKLVEINRQPRIKVSEDISKLTIPCSKNAYRLYGKEGYPLVDLLTLETEEAPKVGDKILCRHPYVERKRCLIVPTRIEPLLKLVWNGKPIEPYLYSLSQIRDFCKQEMSCLREDHRRFLNPTPYKVSVSQTLFDFIHRLWLEETPIPELI